MQTIRLDVSDSIYDNVMFFLNNLPKKDININNVPKKKKEKSLTDFFQHSPLKNEIILCREKEIYKDRIDF